MNLNVCLVLCGCYFWTKGQVLGPLNADHMITFYISNPANLKQPTVVQWKYHCLDIKQRAPLAPGNPLVLMSSLARLLVQHGTMHILDLPMVKVWRIRRLLTGCLKSHQKWSTTEGALAWLNKRSVAAITGFSNVLRIEAALGATAKYLSDEEYVYLEERSGATGVEGHC